MDSYHFYSYLPCSASPSLSDSNFDKKPQSEDVLGIILFVKETLRGSVKMMALIYSYNDIANYSSPPVGSSQAGKCKMISSKPYNFQSGD